MNFSGPEPADFANVRSLNAAFLKHLRRPASGKSLRESLSPVLEPMMAALTDLQIRRLADAPFLLFSLRERDDVYWNRLFADDPTADLFTPERSKSDEGGQLVTAALGFLWQLSNSNPYAARVASGASLNWCERLADSTLLCVLQRTSGRRDLLTLRLADNDDLWKKLLVAGISSEREVRMAAQQCALQTMLTSAQSSDYRRLPAAACNAPAPSLQVAEGPESTRRSKKL
jgi:hypothetical protein